MASEPVSSFRPKGKKVRVVQLPGTRISVHKSQLLLSTGVPPLDALLGGGVAVGSFILLFEDADAVYANHFSRSFLAEGVVNGHNLLLGNLDTVASNVLSNLPAVAVTKKSNEETNSKDETMEIAWRYQNKKKASDTDTSSFGHHFDVKTKMSEDQLKNYTQSFWSPKEKDLLTDFYKSIHRKLTDEKLFTKYKRAEANVLRIVAQHFGSPMWQGAEDLENKSLFRRKMANFFGQLRFLVRRSFSVALVTISSDVLANEFYTELCQYADYAIGLESFDNEQTKANPAFKDYHGLLHIHKLPAINSAAHVDLQTDDLVFKLKRNKLVVEKFHLPPDLSDTASRAQGTGCSSTAMDF